MALTETFTIVRPGQQNATGDVHSQHIAEFTGIVEGTIDRMSVFSPLVPVKPVTGTSTLTNYAVGESTIQKLVPGQTPDGTVNKFGRNSLVIDQAIIARAVIPTLEVFQTKYDARSEIATEHGKKLAKQFDETFAIQATKSGLLTTNTYGLTGNVGHPGGSQVVMANATDWNDPALLYQYLVDLITKMRVNDVDPVIEGCVIAMDPVKFAVLSMAELLINSDYLTSEGTSIPGLALKAHGVRVVQSNNYVGGKNITGHLLSNTENGNAYDGDFTKVIATLFSPRAVMAGETIPLQSKVWQRDLDKQFYVDSWRAYGVGVNRSQYAGVIVQP